MQLKIKRSKEFDNKVVAQDIHGKYPYKLYLQLIGNSTLGKYIVVVSNHKVTKSNEIDSVQIQLKDSVSLYEQIKQNQAQANSGIVRPNSFNGTSYTFKVNQVSILDVEDNPMYVYERVETLL